MRRPGRRFALTNLAASLVASGVLLSMATPVSALTLTLTPVSTGYVNPVYATHPGDGTNRLFVLEQAGKVRIRLESGAKVTFLDIRSKVASGGERGLLGLAFHPDYETSSAWGYRRFYVYYTRLGGDIVIQEYRRSTTNANLADPASARTLLVIEHSSHDNHNGGAMNFGPDGYLYIATGDGGGSGDPGENAQNKDSLLGKLLRISPRPTSIRPYGIPTSNPFYGTSVPGRGEVWSYGLRNPWRFSFGRFSGDLWIGDVGQDRYEEVDYASNSGGRGRGLNFGWDVMEGKHCFEPMTGCSTAGKTLPLFEYSHSSGSGDRCSITGGYRYGGPSAALSGRYLFADYCSGEIFSWKSGEGMTLLRNTTLNITSFGEGVTGKVYITATNGVIYRLDA